MSKESMDSVLVAAKEVLGTGVIHINAETQISQRVLKEGGDSSVNGTIEALKYVLGTKNVNKVLENAIRGLAGQVAKGDKSGLDETPNANPVVENDSILSDAPKEGINAFQAKSFEKSGIGGSGEANAPGAARSQIAAATNSGNTGSGGPGAGAPSVNNARG